MHATVEEKRQEIAELCRKYKVRRLEVFGSAADGDFDVERSDLDFLVEFLPLAPAEHLDHYLGLCEALERIFQRHVDLVTTRSVRNPYFRKSVDRTRTLLYAA